METTCLVSLSLPGLFHVPIGRAADFLSEGYGLEPGLAGGGVTFFVEERPLPLFQADKLLVTCKH